MSKKDKVKKKITAGEILTVIAVVLLLTAGLAFSFLSFTEDAYRNAVAEGAMKTYTEISAANIKLDSLDSIDKFLSDINEFNFTKETAITAVKDGSLKENETAISEIKSSGAGFSFTYYQFINSTLYSIDYENGILGEVEVVYKAEKN